MTLKGENRTSARETSAGRRVILIICAALLGSYLFLVIANKVNGNGGGGASASASSSVKVSGSVTERVLEDGSTETTRGPNVSPAVPNAFTPGNLEVKNVLGDGMSASSTESSNPVVTGTDVPQDDEGYRAAASVAAAAVKPYCTWDGSGSADAYASSIPNLTGEYRAGVQEAARKAWPSVRSSRSSATCEPVTAKNTAPVTFNQRDGQAVVAVQMVQKATVGSKRSSRTVSFKVDVVKKGDAWQVNNIS